MGLGAIRKQCWCPLCEGTVGAYRSFGVELTEEEERKVAGGAFAQGVLCRPDGFPFTRTESQGRRSSSAIMAVLESAVSHQVEALQ
jgi:hypothetical protein